MVIYTSSHLGPTDTSVYIKIAILCHVSRERGSVFIIIIQFCESEQKALEMWGLCYLWTWHASCGKITLAHPFLNPVLKHVTCSTCQGECSYLE